MPETTRETVLRISGTNTRKCMLCGKCSGSCPAYDAMDYRPHQFVSMVERGEIAPLLRSKSLYACMSCFACVERCPRGVQPASLIEALRAMVLREREHTRLPAQLIPELIDAGTPQQAVVSAFRKLSK